MSFGGRLKEARNAKKLTQKEVSGKLGIDHTTISKYENNQSEPDNETLRRLASLYDSSIDFLLGWTQETDPANKLNKYLEYELTDEEIIERLNFKVDNITLSENEVKEFIAFVRGKRFTERGQSAAASKLREF